MLKRSFSTLVLAGVLLLTGAGCGSSGGDTAAAVPKSALQPVSLNYWGVFTDSDDMAVLIAEFQKKHPNIQVQYRKFRPEEYEQKLLEAFAEDRGPDLFTIHNTWLARYKSKLTPAPDKVAYPTFVKSGSGISEKTEVQMKELAGLTLKQMRDQFVATVEQDVMLQAASTSTKKSIYALPFYVDTLALYFNKDLLAQNSIVKPAANWNQLREHAETLTKRVKDSDLITQSAVALGTGSNVHRAGDILMALMAQNGARITKDDGAFIFHTPGNTNPEKDEALPGARALQFYLDFGNPKLKSYTWNPEQGDALDAFTEGRVAYYFGYSYDLSTIRARNPRLNFDVAAMPQFEKPLNIANYWMEAVSNKSTHQQEAWLFVQETATSKEALAKFLKRTKRASALTELIQTQLDDVDLAIFAKQNLTAQTWYHGKDSRVGDQILVELIDGARAKLLSEAEGMDVQQMMQESVNRAAARLNDTL
ncbi:MAG: hypothetical protein A2848_01080 [Candidatus Magasanikbacteria bacterium RIFCSPHIGHO2_01_FULL_50_8]|uniref:ABC transporter substrate-binding protein n=2 Tax=Candidatus Magasanikiibacteriota TaxID=1752731 RepID=A0A1F6LSE1_9BACT|nr:MAG: hypothetical protein A2848_01080 [Candidatus Magasanikbacteria bacterium RIFCSPHIGHO2_01_FULL_50_8]OGH67563.1 MAG: hypothetical protein A3C15_03310 [Candidatus Magasanikbacteria bacterium RIFCSPHIGHO2_02_FULL_50_9b]